MEKESLTNSIALWQGEAKRPGKIIKHNKAMEQFWSLINKKKKRRRRGQIYYCAKGSASVRKTTGCNYAIEK